MRTAIVLSLLLSLFRAMPASADEAPRRTPIEAARREKHIGMGLAFTGLGISMAGFAITIANGGFDRSTNDEKLRFGLGVGFALFAVPLVSAGVTLWSRGAVHERRLRLAPNAVVATF